jgi:hypothetical protein
VLGSEWRSASSVRIHERRESCCLRRNRCRLITPPRAVLLAPQFETGAGLDAPSTRSRASRLLAQLRTAAIAPRPIMPSVCPEAVPFAPGPSSAHYPLVERDHAARHRSVSISACSAPTSRPLPVLVTIPWLRGSQADAVRTRAPDRKQLQARTGGNTPGNFIEDRMLTTTSKSRICPPAPFRARQRGGNLPHAFERTFDTPRCSPSPPDNRPESRF